MNRREYMGVVSVAAAAVAGCAGTGDGDTAGDDAAPTTEQRTPIDKPADELLLSIQDFEEAGWRVVENDDPNVAEFDRVDGDHLHVLYSEAYKSDSIPTAEEAYQERASEISSQYSTESISVGAEGLAYKPTDIEALALFRDANVVGLVEYQFLAGQYAVEQSADVETAIDFAAKQQQKFRG